MAVSYVVAPPVDQVISVTLGADARFSIQRLDSTNAPTNFDAGSVVSIAILISRSSPTVVSAAVSGSLGSFVIPSSVCDTVKAGTQWQIVLAVGGANIPLLVGTFERNDG